MSNGNKTLNNFFNSNKFIGSFPSYKDIKKINNVNDCCFVGRSNVGKSSIINAVTKSKNLEIDAKISEFIDFLSLNMHFRFADAANNLNTLRTSSASFDLLRQQKEGVSIF